MHACEGAPRRPSPTAAKPRSSRLNSRPERLTKINFTTGPPGGRMASSTTPSQPGPDGHRTRTGKLPEPVGGSVRRLTSGPGRSRIPAPDWLGRLVWQFGFNPRLAPVAGRFGCHSSEWSGVDRLGCRWILVPRGLAAMGFLFICSSLSR